LILVGIVPLDLAQKHLHERRASVFSCALADFILTRFFDSTLCALNTSKPFNCYLCCI
jgi:hypothetical protein